MHFKDKIVWITGASSGIGEATALAFCAEGAKVIISARTVEKDKLESVRSRSAHPDNMFCIAFDMEDSNSITSSAEEVIGQFGRVDILMNNAGVSQRSTVLETSLETDRRIMEIDYFSAVILTKAVMPVMLIHGGGHILCTSSMVGVFGFPLRSAYSAAKHALHGFFESLRVEYWDKGIKVNIIIGGRINTPISLSAITSDGSAYGKMDEGQKNGIPAEKAARQILKGIRKNRREILVGGKELLMVKFKRWIPALHFRISTKIKPT